jgi:hypothetical protein
LALAAGCGASSGGRLSKKDYAAKADAVCAKYNKKIKNLGNPRSLADLAAFADKAIPIAQKGNDELRALKPPKDEESTASAWLKQNDKVLDAIKKLRDAAKKNDRKGIEKSLSEGNSANTASNKLARNLGLSTCATG